MYRHSQPRSALLPSPHTRAEPLGANRETPEPTPNAARGSEDPEDRFTTACRQKGRWINAAISFGVDIQHIFRFGIWTDSHNPDANDDDDDEYHSISPQERELLLAAYRGILKIIPKLKNFLEDQSDGRGSYLHSVLDAIQDGCNSARSEAIRRIKDNTIRYLAAGPTPVRVDAHVDHKALRGLNDHNIGRLIIPATDLHEWDRDPISARAGFLSGIYPISGFDMPVFLYEDYTYDPEDPEEGLFRGAFLVCVLIDILFGSNAVETKHVKRDNQPRHHCLGEMYNLVTISPENIAYAAVVARFCLSSKRMWNLNDDNVNYRTFYQAIMWRLGDHEDPWVQDTLAWWNERVFGNEHGKVFIEDANDRADDECTQFERRRAERKAAKLNAMEASLATGSTRASTPDESQGDAAQASTPGPNENDTTLGSPFTPTSGSRPIPAIDPSLLDTPELDSSMLTQASPSVPQTPGAPGPSLQHGSPLSNISDDDTPAQRTEEITLKRKRRASNINRPKARPKRKATRA